MRRRIAGALGVILATLGFLVMVVVTLAMLAQAASIHTPGPTYYDCEIAGQCGP
jgi:hypothetical protein